MLGEEELQELNRAVAEAQSALKRAENVFRKASVEREYNRAKTKKEEEEAE